MSMNDSFLIVFLHLSDLHFERNIKIIPASKIVDALRGLHQRFSDLFIMVSGDIAYSGESEQYKLANIFFNDLSSALKSNWPKNRIHFVFVPGNHDCFFRDNTNRDYIVPQIGNNIRNAMKPEPLSTLLEPQQNFWNWIADFDKEYIVEEKGKLVYIRKYTTSDSKNIAIRCLNTAWMSTRNEKYGQLYFPIDDIEKTDEALVISIFHHPYNWLKPEISSQFRRSIEDVSDFIFTGHEHDGDIYAKNRGTETTLYLEGEVFSDRSSNNKSGFNIVFFDIDRESYQVNSFKWKDELYSNTNKTAWTDFYRKVGLNVFNLDHEFKSWLCDVGIQLTHPHKKLSLQDIFIAPDLSVILNESKDTLEPRSIGSQDTFSFISSHRMVRFTGQSKCGKTSLAKMLFLHSRNNGYWPLFIDCEKLSNIREDTINDLIDKSFFRIYSKSDQDCEKYRQLEKTKKVFICDNFSQNTLTPEAKNSLAQKFAELAENVFLFGNEMEGIEDLFTKAQDVSEKKVKSIHCEIKRFGYHLRHQLIEKWLLIGREDVVTNRTEAHRVKQIEQIVNAFLGNDVVPSYPIFILILLQQWEVCTPLNTNEGSYAHFFDVLIKSDIQKPGSQIDEATKMNYLAELTWSIGAMKRDYIKRNELEIFNRKYNDEYLFCIPLQKIVKDLIDANIFKECDGSFKYLYRYQQYYFLAYYMAHNMDKVEVQSLLNEMIEDVHIEDNANVLIFLTYHAKDNQVVSKIVLKAEQLLNNIVPCDLNDHVKFLNEIQKAALSFTLPDEIDAMKNRKEQLLEMDRNEEEKMLKVKREYDQNEQELEAELGEMLQLNRTIKVIQILGQIARNYAGSMRAEEKVKIVEVCFQAGFRVLGLIYSLFEKSLDDVLEYIREIQKDKLRKLKPEEKDDLIKRTLFIISEMLCYGIIKKVWLSCIGSG